MLAGTRPTLRAVNQCGPARRCMGGGQRPRTGSDGSGLNGWGFVVLGVGVWEFERVRRVEQPPTWSFSPSFWVTDSP